MPETINLREYLSQPTDQTERPKALPAGQYVGTITNFSFDKVRNEAGTNVLYFFIRPERAFTEELQRELDAEKIDLSRRELRKEFYLTENAKYRLADALDAVLGKEPGRTYNQRIPDMRNARVLVGVTPRLDREGNDTGFNSVTTMVAA